MKTIKVIEDSFGEVFTLTYDPKTNTYPVYHFSSQGKELIDDDISLGEGEREALKRFCGQLESGNS